MFQFMSSQYEKQSRTKIAQMAQTLC